MNAGASNKVQPYQDPKALIDCPMADPMTLKQIIGPAALGGIDEISCEFGTDGTESIMISFGQMVNPLAIKPGD